MNRGIAAIWWGMLIATVVAVVPVAVTFLSRALDAARNIERYTGEALAGGIKIAGNTANVAALKDTISVAPGLLAAAGSLEEHTRVIATALAPAPAITPANLGANSTDGRGNGSGNGTGNAEEVQL